jgi:tetratricopeptide (TPR) repeat protein
MTDTSITFRDALDACRRIQGKRLFFIAGTEKSGTTWLQLLLDRHPRIACKGEGQFATRLWPDLCDAIKGYSGFIRELNLKVFNEIEQFPLPDDADIAAIQAFAASLMLAKYGDHDEIQAVGEKTPGHIRTLDMLKRLFPESRFLFISRDGRDIAVSGWHHLIRQHGHDQADPLPAYAARIARVWKSDYEKALNFSKRHPGDCAFVRYEDLHRTPAREMERLLGFLGVDTDPAVIEACIAAARFSNLSRGRERGQENAGSHFRKGIVGDWKNHFDAAAWQAFDTEAGAQLEQLGYERGGPPSPIPESAPEATTTTASNIRSAGTNAPSPAPVTRASACEAGLELAARLRWREALPLLRQADASGPGDYRVRMQLGHALRATKSSEEAALAFASAETLVAGDRDALFHAAISLKEAGRQDDAITAYQRLLAAHPGFAQGWSLLGVVFKETGRLPEAVDAFRAALAIKEDIPTRNALVIALYLADRHDEAIAEGTRNLMLKDVQAMRAFAESPFRKLAIQPNARVFNPKTPHRNVIAFSLWGDDPTYVHGAIVNARIAPHIYYGWSTRFYCDASVPTDAIDQLRQAGAQIVMIDDPALMAVRPLWRFLASDDPGVDWFICRDTDSRLNAQELLAVDAWLRSGKPFHAMRDHIYHMELMLAGMWGGMARVLPNLREMVLSHPQYFNNRFGDQAFLMNLVWPLIRKHILVHDSYYRFGDSVDFPDGYRLPRPVHVGGAIKNMPSWRNR